MWRADEAAFERGGRSICCISPVFAPLGPAVRPALIERMRATERGVSLLPAWRLARR